MSVLSDQGTDNGAASGVRLADLLVAAVKAKV